MFTLIKIIKKNKIIQNKIKFTFNQYKHFQSYLITLVNYLNSIFSLHYNFVLGNCFWRKTHQIVHLSILYPLAVTQNTILCYFCYNRIQNCYYSNYIS